MLRSWLQDEFGLAEPVAENAQYAIAAVLLILLLALIAWLLVAIAQSGRRGGAPASGRSGTAADVFHDTSLEGFQIGSVYSYRGDGWLQAIPRHQITYVGASETNNPSLLVAALVFVLLAVYVYFDPNGFILDELAEDEKNILAGVAGVLAVLFFIAFFFSARVGISIASASGRIMLEASGRQRQELLSQIYTDLAEHQGEAAAAPRVERRAAPAEPVPPPPQPQPRHDDRGNVIEPTVLSRPTPSW
jgi:hypothetical protein